MMMRLEMSEEYEDFSAVKRKRTKRPRPCSSSSSGISTEEDEDMANCLILLARGVSPPPENKPGGSRKFAEMAAVKVGIYVYECKTCNRTFPSFQALGGHRASHKRPKLANTPDRKSSPTQADGQENEEKAAVICHVNEQSKVKIHECSICGSEFGSGQALGGHMRRHRAAAVAPITSRDVDVSVMKHRDMLALDLDLNLPAPPEDVDKFNQFSTAAKDTVFSAAALVGCHY